MVGWRRLPRRILMMRHRHRRDPRVTQPEGEADEYITVDHPSSSGSAGEDASFADAVRRTRRPRSRRDHLYDMERLLSI